MSLSQFILEVDSSTRVDSFDLLAVDSARLHWRTTSEVHGSVSSISRDIVPLVIFILSMYLQLQILVLIRVQFYVGHQEQLACFLLSFELSIEKSLEFHGRWLNACLTCIDARNIEL